MAIYTYMCCIHLYVLYKLFERKKKFPRPTDRDSVTGGTRNKELILDGLIEVGSSNFDLSDNIFIDTSVQVSSFFIFGALGAGVCLRRAQAVCF